MKLEQSRSTSHVEVEFHFTLTENVLSFATPTCLGDHVTILLLKDKQVDVTFCMMLVYFETECCGNTENRNSLRSCNIISDIFSEIMFWAKLMLFSALSVDRQVIWLHNEDVDARAAPIGHSLSISISLQCEWRRADLAGHCNHDQPCPHGQDAALAWCQGKSKM